MKTVPKNLKFLNRAKRVLKDISRLEIKNDDLFNWCVFESMVSYLFKYGIGNETLIELEELFEEDAWISTEEFFLMLEKVIGDVSIEQTKNKKSLLEYEIIESFKSKMDFEFVSNFSQKEMLDAKAFFEMAITKIKESKILNFAQALGCSVSYAKQKDTHSLFAVNSEDKDLIGIFSSSQDFILIKVSEENIETIIHEFAHRLEAVFLREDQKTQLHSLYDELCHYKDVEFPNDLLLKEILERKIDLMANVVRLEKPMGKEIVQVIRRGSLLILIDEQKNRFWYSSILYAGYKYFPSHLAKKNYDEWFAEMCVMITLDLNLVHTWITDKFLAILNS